MTPAAAPSRRAFSSFSSLLEMTNARARAERGDELQREQRNAARALDQNRFAGPHAAPSRDRVPGRQRGDRQRRSFLVRQMPRRRDDRLFVENDGFRQDSVGRRAAERRRVSFGRQFAREPARQKNPRHAVARLPFRDGVADRLDEADPVGNRHARAGRLPVRRAVDDQQIAVIERDGRHFDENLAGLRPGLFRLGLSQRVDAVAERRQDLHCSPILTTILPKCEPLSMQRSASATSSKL